MENTNRGITMSKKIRQVLQHKRIVNAWEREIQKMAKPIAKQCGYKKNSYEYEFLLNYIANEKHRDN